MTIKIVTDTTADLPNSEIQALKITRVPLYINIGEESYLDEVEMSRADFYEGLPNFKHHPTTAVPGIDAFLNTYKKLIKKGATSIFSFHISKSLSNTVDVARLAAEKIKEIPVHVIDSGNLSLGTGLIARVAAKMALAGEKVDQINNTIQDLIKRTYTFAVLDTLEFLKRSGRLSKFQYGLGSLLSVKPILKMNNGETDMERVRTSSAGIKRLLELVKALEPLQELSYVHTHAVRRVEELKMLAKDIISPTSEPLVGEVTPVIGAHIGPGAVGFSIIKK